MSFLNLWFAIGVAAVVLPALLILYFLKLRRREALVSSTLLWKRAVRDLQVNAPFQRLRRNLLLLLQLLILAAALLALARPIVETDVADEARVVILLDRSASMNTSEGEQTRLDQAKEQAVRLVKTLNRRTGGWRSFFTLAGAEPKTQVMVIAFADRASIVSPFTTNTSELVELIEGIGPTDGPTDMREALDLAEAYMAPPAMLSAGMEDTPVSAESPARLVLISDGRIANLDKLVPRGGTMELVRIGQATDNVGITTMRTRRNYERPERLDVFLTVRNFGSEAVGTDVAVYVDGILQSVEPLRLAERPAAVAADMPSSTTSDADDGNSRSLSFNLLLDRAAVIEARLSRRDALLVDNAAFAVASPPRRQRVLVVTDGNYFLDSVVRGLPLREHPFVTPAQFDASRSEYVTEGRSSFDVVIFDKVAPDDLAAGSYLFLGAIPAMEGIEIGTKAERHALIWWDETHPVLRHVALDYVYVAESQTCKLPEDAEVLVEGPNSPALFRYAANGRHCLVLTFAIENSNWWSKLSFAVFVYNTIRYLGGTDSDAQQGPLRPGATLRVAIPPEADQIRLLRPDGGRVTLVPDAFNVSYYGGTERAGVYRVDDGVVGRDQFAVNLEDAWESDITPPTGALRTGTREINEIDAIRTATPEVWRWFIGGALVLVLFEWWVYNRRVMI